MERYELILKHVNVNEGGVEEEIEESYIASLDIDSLEMDMYHSKLDIVMAICDRLACFIRSEEDDTDK